MAKVDIFTANRTQAGRIFEVELVKVLKSLEFGDVWHFQDDLLR